MIPHDMTHEMLDIQVTSSDAFTENAAILFGAKSRQCQQESLLSRVASRLRDTDEYTAAKVRMRMLGFGVSRLSQCTSQQLEAILRTLRGKE